MSNLSFHDLQPKAKNKPLINMNSVILNLISTQKGWIVRQVLKYTAQGSGLLTVWLASKGIITDGVAVSAAVATIATGVVEFALSKAAAPIAAKK